MCRLWARCGRKGVSMGAAFLSHALIPSLPPLPRVLTPPLRPLAVHGAAQVMMIKDGDAQVGVEVWECKSGTKMQGVDAAAAQQHAVRRVPHP
mmetsp:Transcript_30302/g.89880  ORF Transcript_30302/g.89880 Transcript_30302/m.89880 type:complete len:93 (+) Transcript_30302:238-516(+)